MSRSPLPNSLRKFVRREKARIRREFSDTKEADQKIQELMARIMPAYNANKK